MHLLMDSIKYNQDPSSKDTLQIIQLLTHAEECLQELVNKRPNKVDDVGK